MNMNQASLVEIVGRDSTLRYATSIVPHISIETARAIADAASRSHRYNAEPLSQRLTETLRSKIGESLDRGAVKTLTERIPLGGTSTLSDGLRQVQAAQGDGGSANDWGTLSCDIQDAIELKLA